MKESTIYMKNCICTLLMCFVMGLGLVSCEPNNGQAARAQKIAYIEREIHEKQVALDDLRLEANVAKGAGGLFTLITAGADFGLGAAAGFGYAEALQSDINSLEAEIRSLKETRTRMLYE